MYLIGETLYGSAGGADVALCSVEFEFLIFLETDLVILGAHDLSCGILAHLWNIDSLCFHVNYCFSNIQMLEGSR